MVLVGMQWELKIYFSDGHKFVKIYGDDAYLYHFDEFIELLSIDTSCDEDEEIKKEV